MRQLKYLIPLSLILIVAAMYGYYQYSIKQIPAKVAQSQETIINVDSLRFTFKVSLLAQKGVGTYLAAIENKNADQLYDAIDYFDAAIAFTDIAYTANKKFGVKAKELLKPIPKLIEHAGLNHSIETINQIIELANQVSNLAEQEERLTWHRIQENYIEFKTHEYKIIQLYEVLTITFIAFLMISIWLTFRQQKLIKQNRIQQAELEHLAYFDPLTLTANRKSIENEIERRANICKRNHLSFYIALIDIDDFKNVNDLLGHDAGDQLLKKIGDHFKKVTRQEDIVGRFGGDEFLIVFNEYTNKQQLIAVLARLQAILKKPIIINDTEFKVTASIGIASFPKDINPDANNVTQHLIKSADLAMYEAKNAGKNQFHFYNEALETQIKLEHRMEREILRAVEQDEFVLYYQPQLDSKSNQICGAEALVRWQHPERGLVYPGEFIEFIEKGIHTAPFGEWIIKHAIEQQQQWHAKGIEIPISINLSVKHILSSNFYNRIIQIVDDLDADLNQLIFEITEYELIKSEFSAITDLSRLQNIGFRFALDDFGTGYSSISYLSQLPIECIKIDKSFIDYIEPDQEKRKIVDAIIHIGTTLNKKVVAEGVETEYQVQFLRQSGCDLLQGFYYSKPITVNEFERFHRNHKTAP